MSVIESGRHGYQFAKGIAAQVVEGDDEPLREPPHEPREARGEPRDEPPEPPVIPFEPPDEPPLNERHRWIMAEYQAGHRPTRKDIQKANNCSRATAARDLQTLRSLGLLKNGHR
jgi:hypothetical protein